MNYISNIMVNNKCYKNCKYITPKGIMIHSTGANNPYLKRYVQPNIHGIGQNIYNNDWNRESNEDKCVHAFIGKLEDNSVAVVQTLLYTMRGWHAGGNANNTHIGIEICEDNLKNESYLTECYVTAIKLCYDLCNQFNIPIENIISHAEGYKLGIATNHSDIDHWFSKFNITMDMFRADLESFCNDYQIKNVKDKYYIRKVWNDSKTQIGEFTNKDDAITFCRAANPYSVFDINGNEII